MKIKLLNSKVGDILVSNNLNLLFDEEQHKYYGKGEQKISVSKLLDCFKTNEEIEHLKTPQMQAFLKPYAEFGSFIHKQTEAQDKGLVLEPVDYSLKEGTAIENYDRIRVEQNSRDNGKLIAIELSLYSEQLNVCGTIDRLFFDRSSQDVILVDIKTGNMRDSHGYQQLIYSLLLNEGGIEVNRIALISLKDQGKIKFYDELPEDKQKELNDNVEKYIVKKVRKEKNNG